MNVLITGGASGLGKDITLLLAKDNKKSIHITYNSSKDEALSLSSKNNNVNCINLNFKDTKSINSLISLIPKLDIDVLINNAYSGSNTIHFNKIDIDILKKSFENNILPTLLITKSSINIFKTKKFGKIINILSSYIKSKPKVGLSEYIANKSYLLSMSNSWASEFARHNITSNSISPSFMKTNFTKNIDPRIIETIKNNNPLRELLKTKDVAEAVEYFVNCSQQVNGQNLVINNNLD